MRPETDDETCRLFLSGKPAGLEAAYRLHGNELVAVARSVLGEHGALDCVHDVLLRLWRRPEAYRPERGALRAFLHVSVRNEAIGRKRLAARRFDLERRSAADVEPTYGFTVNDHVERGKLQAAVRALPAEQREALSLAYFGHLTQAEIARHTGEPLGTVKGRIALAVRKLKRALLPPEDAR